MMDEDEDEIDILGDFDLENLLTQQDRRQSYSFSSNDNYGLSTSEWALESSNPLFGVKSVLTSDQFNYDTLAPLNSSEEIIVDDNSFNSWTDKEKILLDRGLDLFGKSYARLSQYIGTKNATQVKQYLRNNDTTSMVSNLSTTSLNLVDLSSADEAMIHPSIEVVISSISADKPVAPNYALSNSSLDFESDLGSNTDSYGSSTSSRSSSPERNIVVDHRKSKPKSKKACVRKRSKIVDESSDEDLDYENTNIIWKPRELSKYHLMVSSGDQVMLPSGEEVIKIKKEDSIGDVNISLTESEDETRVHLFDKNKRTTYFKRGNKLDYSSLHPNSGCKIKRYNVEKKYSNSTIERNRREVEVDVGDETDIANNMCGNTQLILSDMKHKQSTSSVSKKKQNFKLKNLKLNRKNSKLSKFKQKLSNNKRLIQMQGNNNLNYKNKYVNIDKTNETSSEELENHSCPESNVTIIENSNERIIPSEPLNKEYECSTSNVYSTNTETVNTANLIVYSETNSTIIEDTLNTSPVSIHSPEIISDHMSIHSQYVNHDIGDSISNRFEEKSKNQHNGSSFNIEKDNIKTQKKCLPKFINTSKKIIFKEIQFKIERNNMIHVDDLIKNYDFSTVRLIDNSSQMERIKDVIPTYVDRIFKHNISIEEVDYHRDFFLHNDLFFIMRYIRIRNHIIKVWNSNKPNHVNRTMARAGLKHCGDIALITRVHFYLERKGHINTDN